MASFFQQVVQIFQSSTTLILFGLASAIAAGVALIWAKHPVRWILAVVTVGLAVVLFPMKLDPDVIDPGLPSAFRAGFNLKVWLFGLAVVALYTITHFTATLIRLNRPAVAEGAGTFPDIDTAWDEIQIRLSQARIDTTGQNLYLLLTPDEALSAAVVEAAGLGQSLFAQAPAAPEAPVHVYAVSDALLLSCAGASSLGRDDQEGTARLEYLCRLIADANPEHPTLRGVAVLLPFEWASVPDGLKRAAAVREDLQTIRRAFQVRCPTLALYCLRGTLTGFEEFAARLPANMRQNRCGFSVPASVRFGAEAARHGMAWMAQWFRSWSLNLMVQDAGNKDGNSALLTMNAEFRRSQGPLATMLETALTMHQQAEPVFFRGCYFVACGPAPEQQAFAVGLLRGKRARLLADQELASWSRDADRLDRRYRRIALGLGLLAAAVALPIWLIGILPRLQRVEKAWLGWVGLVALALLWAAVLLAPRFRRPAPAPARPAPARA